MESTFDNFGGRYAVLIDGIKFARLCIPKHPARLVPWSNVDYAWEA